MMRDEEGGEEVDNEEQSLEHYEDREQIGETKRKRRKGTE